MSLNRRAFEIGAIVVALSLLGAMVYLLTQAHGLVLASGQPLFGDFITFWSAGRAALDGHAADVYDAALIRHYHEVAAPGVAFFATWNSPPTFLLFMSALATMPFPVAALVFLAASASLYLYAARHLLGGRDLIFAATLPAALYHLGSVQTGLLIGGFSGLALAWLDKRPLVSGALVSVLAIKPHLAILWPVMLLLSGRWRAFASAAVCTTLFVCAAGLAFGFDAYARFVENLGASQSIIASQRVSTPAYASLYANLLGLGAPPAMAIGAHALSAAAAALVAGWMFLRRERVIAGAALCAATLLISPYLFFYDFTLLAAGAALLGAPRDRFELVAAALAWSAGLSLVLGYLAPLPLCPLAAWMVLLVALRRARSVARRPARALRT